TKSVLDYLRNVSPAERTESDFGNAVQFATELARLLPEDEARELAHTLRDLGPTFITLRAVYEQMRYDKQFMAIQVGKPVAITLDNQDAMPHNLVILVPGALEEIGLA